MLFEGEITIIYFIDIIVALFLVTFIYLNVTTTVNFKTGLLHWDSNNYDRFWSTFGRYSFTQEERDTIQKYETRPPTVEEIFIENGSTPL